MAFPPLPPRVRDQAPVAAFGPDGAAVRVGQVMECPTCGRIVWDSNARLGPGEYIRHKCGGCNQMVVQWGSPRQES